MTDITEEKQIETTTEPSEVEAEATETAEVAAVAAPAKRSRVRGKKYVEARSMVDRTQVYPITQAIELLKTTSYAKFGGTVSAHLNLKRELKPVDVTFPHSTGKEVRVAIASDAILADLAEGKVEFDVLLTTPELMPKLAKFARLLGPKGLMPNPKTGTVTSDPEAKKAQLQGGAATLRGEKKAPLMHVRLGKVSQPSEELVANLQALLAALPPNSILKLTIASSMSPGIKVQTTI